jgi:hypothetical protein
MLCATGCGRTTSDATASTYAGTFALPGKTQKADASLRVSFTSPTTAHLDLVETEKPSGATITAFDTDMTKKLHMIVISDDFSSSSFQHVHPALGGDGHFTIDLSVPAQGRYLIYADDVPHGLGQQVFLFDVPFGSNARATPNLVRTPKTVAAGPYTVTLSSLKLDAGQTTMLTVRIDKNGKPATDLQPYLGGAAHAVFIGASDDSYVHVHAMAGTDMSSMSMDMGEMRGLPDSAKIDPAMMLHVAAPKAGAYKLWLQFRGGGQLYVAPFVLTAS